MDGFEKYARQTRLEDFPAHAQKNLLSSKALLVGLGGVGGGALPLLAGAGVGKIICVDFDAVAESNLHRQTLYTLEDIGKPKASAAKVRAEKINADVEIITVQKRIENVEDALELLKDCDICIDACDSFETRFILAQACAKAGVNQIMASAQGYEAQTACFGSGAKISDLFDAESAKKEKSAPLPIFGPAANLSGVIAAGIAIRALAKAEAFPFGMFLSFDMRNFSFKRVCFKK